MANSSEILEHVLRNTPQSPVPITYQWLLPNVKGFDNFLKLWNAQSTAAQDAYPTPPPSPRPDSGPALNTSSEDPNAMPSANSGAEAMGKERSAAGSLGGPIHEISIFTAATEAFTQKNTNCSIAESLQRFEPIMSKAKDMWELYRADVGTRLGRGSLDDKFARNGTLTLSHQKPAASNIHTNCYTIESG